MAATAESVASFQRRRTPLQSLQHFLHGNPAMVPVIILAVSVAGFGLVAGERFFSAFNLSLIIQQVTVIGFLAAAQTLIILTAGIDLSVGAIMMLSAVVMGKLAVSVGMPSALAIPLGFICGTACGFVNGLLVTRLRLPPFIVTLGTWNIFYALMIAYSGSQSIRGQDIDATAASLKFFGERVQIGGAVFTYGSFLMLATFVVLWFALNRTAWGRHVYAVGDDKEAADLSGILTDRLLLSVYAVAGLVCGLAAWGLDRARRLGQSAELRRGEPRFDHCRGHRRHVALRRARHHHGRAVRGAHRRRVQLRAEACRGGRHLAEVRHRLSHHPRGGHRPVDPEDLQLSASATSRPDASDRASAGFDTGKTPGSVTGPGTKNVMEARGLVKRYGRVTAIDEADFDLREGEILAVIGDNGAGKSSMIKAISGAVVPDAGTVRLDGREVSFRSPMEARARPASRRCTSSSRCPPRCPSPTTCSSAARSGTRGGLRGLLRMLDKKRMEELAREKLSELGLMTIQNIGQAVETLSGGQRQGVAVARAAAFGSRVIIMDEPTAALGVKESRRVLELILDVRSRGMPIVLISHNMPHVFEVADRVHVHRLGKRLCLLDPKDFTMNDAVAFMTGAAEPPPETLTPDSTRAVAA